MKSFGLIALAFTALTQPINGEPGECTRSPPPTVAPYKNVWRSLSDKEFEDVSTLLNQRFNLTSGSGTIIYSMEVISPNKTDVLQFLKNSSAPPAKYVRATMAFGSSSTPYLEEYLVGPLPKGNGTSVQPLRYPFNNKVPGKTIIPRFLIADPSEALAQFWLEIEDITKKLWNTTGGDGGVELRTQFPPPEAGTDGSVMLWAEFLGTPVGVYEPLTLLPLGVSVRFSVPGFNQSNWAVTGWYCLGKFYSSSGAFRAAIFSEDFKLPPPNEDGPWAWPEGAGTSFPSDKPLPVSTPQDPQNFAIDLEESHVSWKDFSFFLSTPKSSGLSLYDIHYRGNRIIYEIALQEALAHYASSDPVQQQTAFFDTAGEGLGNTMRPLIPGFDCPSYATYVNATITSERGNIITPNAICLFEFDTGYPIRRHFHQHSDGTGFTDATKNVAFTIRTVSTVGNYDYLIDYIFGLDGAIEISARASGYISAAYATGNEGYGFQIHDYLSGAMHDHVLPFKVDFDIMGLRNSVQKIEAVPTTMEYPWAPGRLRNTMKAEKSFITNEDDSRIDWASNDAAIYAIVNKEAPNRFGEYPGYRIRRAAGTSYLTVRDSSATQNAARYAEHGLYITKQKDTEPRAADPVNALNVQDPLVDFSKFLDGESLEQEDLVVWVNLGMHHLPHTGDLPYTLTTSAHSSIRLEPLNYLEGDVLCGEGRQGQ